MPFSPSISGGKPYSDRTAALRKNEDKRLKTAYMSGQRTARFNMPHGAQVWRVRFRFGFRVSGYRFGVWGIRVRMQGPFCVVCTLPFFVSWCVPAAYGPLSSTGRSLRRHATPNPNLLTCNQAASA